MLRKLVVPSWGNRLVAEITASDVDKLLTKITAGRPSVKGQAQQSRAQAVGGKTHPDPRQQNRRGAPENVHTGRCLEMAHGQSRHQTSAPGQK